jgi:fungalysin metallopeptidase (M36)
MPGFFDNSEVVWDPGRVRPIKVNGQFPLPQAVTPVDSIKQFLTVHAQDLGLRFPVAGLTLRHQGTTPVRTVYRFQPNLDGLPILDTELLVHVDKQHRILQIDNTAGPSNVIAAPAGAHPLTPDQAFKAASDALGSYTKRLDTPPPSAGWFPTKAGLVRVYLVLIATTNPARDWELVIDAYSGRVLRQRNLIKEMPDGTGMVFDPNPVVTAGTNTLRDPTATTATCGFTGTVQSTIDAQRVSRTLKDLTVTGGSYQLKGPYCEIHNFAAPASIIPQESSGNFNYTSDNERFEAVMVYYHIDSYQRYLQSIGITTAHPTSIQCDPHDNSITAAWYSPSDKGLHFSDSGSCRPDRAEDADCMIHEYGHAIQDYQVPGWGGTNPVTGRDETGAMGEGFGDFQACAYFADRNSGFQREVFEDWVFGPGGLRRVDGTKVYPTGTGVVAPWTWDVHDNGEIWSAALWNTYRAIGGDSPSAADHEAARRAMLRSVINSHPLVATNGTMPDGAEAVMRTNAELEEYRGKHLMQMLDSFHDRGLLPVSASADLFLRDDPGDPGAESYHAPVFWDSPDVWVRNADDSGTAHQEPKAGQDNWFYARVHNRGAAACRALVVTFNVKLWLGTQFLYPADFVDPFISAAPAFNLAPGTSTIVKAKWPAAFVPAAGSHGCLLVSAYTPREHVPAGTHVWDHGNLAQKNLHVLPADAGDSVFVAFRLGNRLNLVRDVFRLEIRKPLAELGVSLLGEQAVLHQLLQGSAGIARDPTPVRSPAVLSVTGPSALALSHHSMASPVSLLLERGSRIELGAPAARPTLARTEFLKADVEPVTDANHQLAGLRFLPGKVVGLPIDLKARQDLGFRLKIDVPATARSGDSYVFDVVQRDLSGQTIGGLRVKVVVN